MPAEQAANTDPPSMPIPVHLHVYDLSQGMARSLSPVLLGRQLDGVWHTAVVVAGKEWYFGQGISCGRAGATRFGTPDQVRGVWCVYVLD